MKRIWLFFVMVSMYQNTAMAQDLIVTADGDSINCKIAQIKDRFIHFTFPCQDEVCNSLMPLAQVERYKYKYYVVPRQRHKPEYQTWRLSFNAGWGYRTAPLGERLKYADNEYVRKIRNGYNFSFDASRFFTEMFGVGLKYDMFRTSNSFYVDKESFMIQFAGPVFVMRILDRKKSNGLVLNYGIGYTGFSYKNKRNSYTPSGMYKDSTVGLATGISYDIASSKTWSAGFQLSYLSGGLKLKEGLYEGLGRVNVTLGIRCNL